MSRSRPIDAIDLAHLYMTPQQVSDALRIKRELMGISRSDLAKQLRVTTTTISRWESAKFEPNALRLVGFLLGPESPGEALWKMRALVAESTLRDVNNAINEYRDTPVGRLRSLGSKS